MPENLTLHAGDDTLRLERSAQGYGLALYRDGALWLSQETPILIDLRDYGARNLPLSACYQEASLEQGGITARGTLPTPAGSVFSFEDRYTVSEDGRVFELARTVTVVSAHPDDVGFCSRVSLQVAGDAEILNYDYFAPGTWYRHNEGVRPHSIFWDKTLSTYWYRETRNTLPMFFLQHRETGHAAGLCHLHPDLDSKVYENTSGWVEWLNDESLKYGSLGIHRETDRLYLDYVYPGTEGQENIMTRMHNRADNVDVSWLRRSNPVRPGFIQAYTLALWLDREPEYYKMMTSAWRYFYRRFDPEIIPCDLEKVYVSGLELLDHYCREYNGVMGLPFTVNLPGGEADNVSFQFGFVGQQAGVGYQLMRYGDERAVPSMSQKGRKIIDFWAENSLTPWGLPKTWYKPNEEVFHDCPINIRLVADGMEAVLDSYTYTKSRGEEHPRWLAFCRTVGDWFVENQNEDGSFWRSFDFDGKVLQKSPYNTTNPIRFLVGLFLATGDENYRETALKAGAYSFEKIYRDFMYVGATFDNPNTLDKEAGIYALFAFTALYDLTGEKKWLEAAVGAADFTETWTYCYTFPVYPLEPSNAYHRANILSQSPVVAGGCGSDIYMAACPFAYFRLWLLTGDRHYRQFAQFILHDTKQTTNWDGQLDYRLKGLCEESGDVSLFTYRGSNIWLPWCTFVQVDPLRRFLDEFGSYDGERAEASR